jgi:hypothetical protein
MAITDNTGNCKRPGALTRDIEVMIMKGNLATVGAAILYSKNIGPI